ncbi:MAG TPA: acyl-CoA desaturase [Rugosimonospora sp.]
MTTATATPPTTRGSDFAILSRRIAGAGLMKRRPGYYLARIGLVVAFYVGSWALFVAIGNSWYELILAPVLAVALAQLALVSHDIAHRQVFRTRRASEIAGLIAGNLGIGMSYGWWMDKHTRHHANPNHEDRDPDLAPDVLVWSTRQARLSRGIPRMVGRWQAFLFFPLITLEGFSLHANSIRALGRPTLRHRWAEALMLMLHFAGYLTVALIVLSPAKALVFLAINQAAFGVYLGCTFAPNHKGMALLNNDGEEPDFLRRQVLTSRNVRGGHLVTVLLGGLNYQIEHHLFPSMPTPNLRRARLLVREFCTEAGVTYTETGLIDSYRQALQYLHETGAPLRGGAEPQPAVQ